MTENDAAGSHLRGAAVELATEIRRLRIDAGLSQKELAAQVGYTRQYVSLAERTGGNLPSLELVHALDTRLNADGRLLALRKQARTHQQQRRRGLPAAAVLSAGFAPPFPLALPPTGQIDENQYGDPRPVLAASAERARDFLMQMEVSTVGNETLDQLSDDVRRLAVAYQVEPLDTLLADMVDTQRRAFTLLEGHQRPEQTRELYLLAGVSSGLMARASHDLGASHEAMTQARAAFACADNAGHDGLRSWVRGLQALIAYWAGNPFESVRYAQRGAEYAARTRGTARVWLASLEARSLAALGRLDDIHTAVDHATEAREQATGDDLDDLGGLCTFSLARQHYYAADALAWAGPAEAEHTETRATAALDAYQAAPTADRAFGDRAGARCALAIARVSRGEVEGAADAIGPVLDLPQTQRTYGIVTSVGHVQRALATIDAGRTGGDLAEHMHTFTTERMEIAQ